MEAKEELLRRLESAGRGIKKAMAEALKQQIRPKVLFTVQMGQPAMEVELAETFIDDDDAVPNAFTDVETEAYNAMVAGIVYSTDLSITEARTAARMSLIQMKKLGLLRNEEGDDNADDRSENNTH